MPDLLDQLHLTSGGKEPMERAGRSLAGLVPRGWTTTLRGPDATAVQKPEAPMHLARALSRIAGPGALA